MVRAFALFPSCLLFAGTGAETPVERPDVLVVLVDTLRADRLPFLGCARDTAPFLTSWAARSIVFEHAWAASSWTAPAMASVFTGVYPPQHGVLTGRLSRERLLRLDEGFELNRIPPALETLPEFLRGLGYRTFGVAANENIGAELGFDQGFDRLAMVAEGDARQVAGVVRAWKREILAARPWFLYLHLMDPHSPYEKREPWFKEAQEALPGRPDLAAYDSEIRFLDGQLADIFRCLEVGERTLVVFLADHGEEFGDHGGKYHGPQLYSELIHVPFFLHHPGVPPRRVTEDVSQVDLLPTLREVLGAPPSEQDEGTSLVGTYARDEPLPERSIYSHRRGRLSELHCVIAIGLEYIVTEYDPETETPGERELYDLRADPRETNDRMTAEPDVADWLDGRLRRFLGSARRWQDSWRARATPELLERIDKLAASNELPRDLERIARHRKERAGKAAVAKPPGDPRAKDQR